MGHEPPALQARPQLNETELLYWDIYQELHAGRQSNGFGYNVIALRDILDMADMYEIQHHESRLSLIRVIRAMDRTYLEQVAKKNG